MLATSTFRIESHAIFYPKEIELLLTRNGSLSLPSNNTLIKPVSNVTINYDFFLPCQLSTQLIHPNTHILVNGQIRQILLLLNAQTLFVGQM